jgi:hypothetical protein
VCNLINPPVLFNPYVCRKDISLGAYIEYRTSFFFPIIKEEHLLILLAERENKE